MLRRNKKELISFFVYIGYLAWFLFLFFRIPFYDPKNDIFISWDGTVHYEIMKLYASSNCWICYIPNHCWGLLIPIFYPPFIFIYFKILYFIFKSFQISLFILLITPIVLYFLGIYFLYRKDIVKLIFALILSSIPLYIIFIKRNFTGIGIVGMLHGLLAQQFVVLLCPLIIFFAVSGNYLLLSLVYIISIFSRPFDAIPLWLSTFVYSFLNKDKKLFLSHFIPIFPAIFYYSFFVFQHTYRFEQNIIVAKFPNLFITAFSINFLTFLLLIFGVLIFAYKIYKGKISDLDFLLSLAIVISTFLSTGIIKLGFYGHYYRYSYLAIFYIYLLLVLQLLELPKNFLLKAFPFIVLIFLHNYFNVLRLWTTFNDYYYEELSRIPKVESKRLVFVTPINYWLVEIPHVFEALYIENNYCLNCLYTESNPIYDLYKLFDYEFNFFIITWGRKPYFNVRKGIIKPIDQFLEVYPKLVSMEAIILPRQTKILKYYNITTPKVYEFEFSDAYMIKNFYWLVAPKNKFNLLIEDFILNKRILFILVDPKTYSTKFEELKKHSNRFVFFEKIDCRNDIQGYLLNGTCKYYKHINSLSEIKGNATFVPIKIKFENGGFVVETNESGIALLKYQYWDGFRNCYIAEPFFFACKVKKGTNIFSYGS